MELMQIVEGMAILPGDKFISKWAVDTGRLDHDQWLLPKLRGLIKDFGTCLDVGAYIGDHTIAYGQWFEQVYAFEPNPYAYQCLRHNLSKYANVECINRAVGHNMSHSWLRIPEDNPGAAQITSEDTGVPVWYWDDIDGIEPDFIKIDAEGAELTVLLTLQPLIEEYHPQMLIEQRAADGNEKLVGQFLEKHGYDSFPIQGERGAQYDLFCE